MKYFKLTYCLSILLNGVSLPNISFKPFLLLSVNLWPFLQVDKFKLPPSLNSLPPNYGSKTTLLCISFLNTKNLISTLKVHHVIVLLILVVIYAVNICAKCHHTHFSKMEVHNSCINPTTLLWVSHEGKSV